MTRFLTTLLTALGILASIVGCGEDSTVKKLRNDTKSTSIFGGGTGTCVSH
jgi:hypothetical protein